MNNSDHKNDRVAHFMKGTFFILLFATLIIGFVSSPQTTAVFSQNETYARPITIENNLGVQTDYEVEVIFDTQSLISSGKLQTDCQNIMFTDNAGVELDAFLESGCNTTDTRFWVRIPTLNNGTNHINMLYGSGIVPASRLEWTGGQFIAPFDGTCPSDWTLVTALNSTHRFARGAQTYGLTGGSETHNHSYSGRTFNVHPSNIKKLTDAPEYTYPTDHSHLMNGTTEDANNLPPYKDVVYCVYSSGNLPDGTGNTSYLGFFETVPSGWSRDPSFDGRFLRGSGTSGAVGGSSTHTHTFSGTTLGGGTNSTTKSSYVGNANVRLGATNHTHGYNGETDEVNHLPPYLDMLIAHPDTTNAPIPSGSVGLFTQLPPLGWEAYAALDGRFIRGSDTFGGSGGAISHNHMVEGTTLQNGPNPGTHLRTFGYNHKTYDQHVHDFSFPSHDSESLPPYLEVVFGLRRASLAANVGEEGFPTPTAVPPTATPVATATATSSGDCTLYYDKSDDWGTAFVTYITLVNNTSTPIVGYTVNWDFTGNQQLDHGWEATVTQSGPTITVHNSASHWNGTIPVNDHVHFGFEAVYSGTNELPINFTLSAESGGCVIAPIDGEPPNHPNH